MNYTAALTQMRIYNEMLGEFNMRKISKAKIFLAVMLLAVLTAVIAINLYTESLNQGLSDNLIRLHVVANSDSPEDQALKRDVRDAVLSYIGQELDNPKGIEQTKEIINDKLEAIKAVAKEEALKHSKNCTVLTTLGTYPFPTKAYGDITLPAGNYQALRVVIGKGEGANWWCVLFPPLCFVDVTHGIVPDSVKAELKEVLSEQEYDIVTSANDENDIPIKIKFKIVELFQDTKVRFAGALNRLLKYPG